MEGGHTGRVTGGLPAHKWTRAGGERYDGAVSLLIRGARVLVPSGLVYGADVLVDAGRVRAIGAYLKGPRDAETVEARGAMLAPGLVDLQINGAYGANFSEAVPGEVVRAAVRLAEEGVTSFLPTLISLPLKRLEAALGRLAAASRLGPGARIAGVHVEGPFLSKARRGAHRAANIRRPSVREFERLWRASRGLLRV
ncbi:MAG: N-acetylglucosamine-6-phosphate deacetylase, partial [Elusimicrobia bacterium]